MFNILSLQAASGILEDAPQTSESIKLASTNLCKAIAKTDLLKHKDKVIYGDRVLNVAIFVITYLLCILINTLLTFFCIFDFLQEVRLFTVVCAIHTLRLHAPENPYTDAQLLLIFRQLLVVFRELADPGAAQFQVCLSLLQTVATVKICLLMLDLESADSLVLDLFTTMFEAINADNKEQVEHLALTGLATMLDEGDDIPQPLLDCILGHLLPTAHEENPQSHRLAELLIRKSQPTLQPYVQKFMTRLLEGQRTDSDLIGCSSDLVLQLYRAAPQIMLPVLPHLQPSLQVDSEERRLDAVDLICKLLTHPGAHTILEDYRSLPQAVLRRLNDKSPEVRLRVISHAKALSDSFNDAEQRSEVAKEVALRLQDPDERLRSAAAAALCAIASEHPSAVHTEQIQSLVLRFRDKRLSVRKEVAAQVAKLVRTWSVKWEAEGGASQPRKELLINLVMGLCGLALTRDTELASYVMDEVFKGGVFPARLPAASTAAWWAQLWNAGDGVGGQTLTALLRAKCDLQRQVQELLRLREAALGERTGAPVRKLGATTTADGDAKERDNDAKAGLDPVVDEQSASTLFTARITAFASSLSNLNRAEEGLQRLWNMKDNHIFRSLGTLSTYGTSLADAVAAGKDVQSRVGSRGPHAEVAQALIARLTPNLISPETLSAALRASCDSTEEESFITGVVTAAPQLFAQQLPALTELFEEDDAMSTEVAAKVLAATGGYMTLAAKQLGQEFEASPEIISKLQELCLHGTPTGAKAAVRALLHILDADAVTPVLRGTITKLLESLREPETLAIHSRTLAALKAISTATRAVPALLTEFALELYDCVINRIMQQDLSKGRPLTLAHDSTGKIWNRPSPDVEIKSAALRTLAQALVPDDTTVQPSEQVSEVVTAFIAELGDLTDLNVDADAFQHFHWNKMDIKWFMGKAAKTTTTGSRSRKRKSDENEDHDDLMNDAIIPEGYTDGRGMEEEERQHLEEQTRINSPDCGWVRYSAATALFRLFRAYDPIMTGNDYLTMGLACQDSIAEVRLALMDKISSTVGHFLTSKVPNPQRAAKTAALYVLYSKDREVSYPVLAFGRLKEYVTTRRAAVEKSALAVATAGDSGTLINEMPEFILPFIVYFMAHHPDYDHELIYREEAHSQPEEDSVEEQVVEFFRLSLQMALEALLLPPGNAVTEDQATEVARQAGATLKILRQLKFCDILDVATVRGQGDVDEGATICSHQICDMALCLSRQLLRLVMGNNPQNVQKFPGMVALPRLCYRPKKNVAAGDRRRDGSDLPRTFRPVLDTLYTHRLSPGTPAGAAPKKKARRRVKARDNGEVVEQRQQQQQGGEGESPVPKPRAAAKSKQVPANQKQQRKRANASSTQIAAAAKKATTAAAAAAAAAAVPSSPARQQPRRGAKDVADAKMRKAGDESETDDMEWELSGSEPEASPAAPNAAAGAAAAGGMGWVLPSLKDLAPASSGETSSDSDLLKGQENGGAVYNLQQEHGSPASKATGASGRSKRVKA
jgi:sister chromatid cohesion protein PDS5